MKLESVREIKLQIRSQLESEALAAFPEIPSSLAFNMLSAGPESFAAFTANKGPVISAQAQRVRKRAVAASRVAIGVAGKKEGDYKLAIRPQQDSPDVREIVDSIASRVPGEIDLDFTGRIVKEATPYPRRKLRPLELGCSVGHTKITAGTLGCFVRMPGDPRVMILSNNHVLANENNAKIGDDILQPGPDDSGNPPPCATLLDWVTLNPNGINVLDAAVAVLDPAMAHLPNLIGPKGRPVVGHPIQPVADEKVIKYGRTTERREGRIRVVELDKVVVGYGIGDLRFDHQVEIEGAGNRPFSEGGDSGSLIVDDQYRPLALLFAGSEQGGTNNKGLTYANPLPLVFQTLGLVFI